MNDDNAQPEPEDEEEEEEEQEQKGHESEGRNRARRTKQRNDKQEKERLSRGGRGFRMKEPGQFHRGGKQSTITWLTENDRQHGSSLQDTANTNPMRRNRSARFELRLRARSFLSRRTLLLILLLLLLLPWTVAARCLVPLSVLSFLLPRRRRERVPSFR